MCMCIALLVVVLVVACRVTTVCCVAALLRQRWFLSPVRRVFAACGVPALQVLLRGTMRVQPWSLWREVVGDGVAWA